MIETSNSNGILFMGDMTDYGKIAGYKSGARYVANALQIGQGRQHEAIFARNCPRQSRYRSGTRERDQHDREVCAAQYGASPGWPRLLPLERSATSAINVTARNATSSS